MGMPTWMISMSSVKCYMTYRGYKAQFDYCQEDEALVGHILGITGTIGFHGDNWAELRTAFKHVVDGYLDDCKILGIRPEVPYGDYDEGDILDGFDYQNDQSGY